MSLPVIIVGGGGHAKVLIEALKLQGIKIHGIADPAHKTGETLSGIGFLGDDTVILEHSTQNILLVNGVGTIKVTQARRNIFESFKAKGYSFQQVIHPKTIIASDTVLGEGVQIMAGAIIQPGSQIGDNTIINTKASVDHDCKIGAHVHLAPGVTLSGNVTIGSGCHIGTSSIVVQGITIEADSFIRSGKLVIQNTSPLKLSSETL
jgi:sugar O-acyltransferase (sialic acid O-acetyltransferase NeuD family)